MATREYHMCSINYPLLTMPVLSCFIAKLKVSNNISRHKVIAKWLRLQGPLTTTWTLRPSATCRDSCMRPWHVARREGSTSCLIRARTRTGAGPGSSMEAPRSTWQRSKVGPTSSTAYFASALMSVPKTRGAAPRMTFFSRSRRCLGTSFSARRPLPMTASCTSPT